MSDDGAEDEKSQPNTTERGIGTDYEFEDRWIEKAESVGEKRWLDSENERPQRPALVKQNDDPWLEQGRAGLVVAPGGTGKSTAMIQLGICVAAGCDRWLDALDVCRQGKVLMLLGEHDDYDAREDVLHAADVMGLDEEERNDLAHNLHAIPLYGEDPQLVEEKPSDFEIDRFRLRHVQNTERPGQAEKAKDMLAKYERGVTAKSQFIERILGGGGPWRLVIVDPLRRFASGDTERDSENANRFIELLEDWTTATSGGAEFGPTVLATHHTGKKLGGDNQSADFYRAVRNEYLLRGSSGLGDSARWVANMVCGAVDTSGTDERREPDIRDLVLMAVAKSNRTAENNEIVHLVRQNHGILTKARPDLRGRDMKPRAEIEAERDRPDDQDGDEGSGLDGTLRG